MTAHTRFRVAAVIGALIAPMALVAAASAPAVAVTSKHKHEVTMYKVERPLRLGGVGDYTSSGLDSTSQTLRCNSGDYVLDGMWSVKHVDQYNPPAPDPDDDPSIPSVPTVHGQYDDERDVWIKASYPSPADFRSWNFEFENKAWGDAQVKIFLTCIKGTTEPSSGPGHQVRVRNVFAGPNFYADGPTVLGPLAFGQQRFYTDSSVWGTQCNNPYEYFVAPGFQFVSPTHTATPSGYRPIASYPTGTGRSWAWEFATDGTSAVPTHIRTYGRCLERRVWDGIAPGGTPRHSIMMLHLPGLPFGSWFTSNIPQDDPQERQFSCDQNDPDLFGYKAMVAWWYLDSHWWDNWFLGMEPRPKTRSFYFWNHFAGSSSVKYGVLCINSRTSTPLV